MMESRLIGIFPRGRKGKLHVYEDRRSDGQRVVRFMLHKKRGFTHIFTMPLMEFRRLSVAVLSEINITEREFELVNGGRL